jgi:UPF0716 protein FxsA
MTSLRFILLAILALPVAEMAAFLLAAQAFGFFRALLAVIAGSLLGVAILANAGRTVMSRLRRTLSEGRVEAEAPPSRLMTAFAGLLLAIPGLLTDIAGLLLLVPWVRQWLVAAFPRGRRSPDGVLDLNPAEWRRIPEPKIGKSAKSTRTRPKS